MSCDTRRRQLWRALGLDVSRMETIFRRARRAARGRRVSLRERSVWAAKTRALLDVFDRHGIPRPVHSRRGDLPRLSATAGYAAVWDALGQHITQETRSVAVGASPFRPDVHGEGAPEAARSFNAENATIAAHILAEVLAIHGVENGIETTLGVWAGTEPSLNVTVRGSLVAIRGAMAEWGKRHNQDAVALIYPQPSAPGLRTVWRFDPPLESETGDTLLNRIGELKVFATAHYDQHGRLVSLERWDRGIDPENEGEAIAAVDAMLTELGVPTHATGERGYRVEFIERWEYEGLIDLSRPGRAAEIEWGQNLGDYRPLSRLPKPR